MKLSAVANCECATQTPEMFQGVMEAKHQKEKENDIEDNFMLYSSMICMHNVCFY
jgi:hypothetical protein